MNNRIGSLIIDIHGKTLTPEDSEVLAHPSIGGVILFSRNYESRNQLRVLVQSIRKTRDQVLLILVDQEGGRVQRFINEFIRLPSMASIGNNYVEEPSHSLKIAKECGWLMATELLTTHIDLSIAPILDLNKGMNTVIGDRAFHSDPNFVSSLAHAFLQGMKEAGMSGVGKHFPGHGAVLQDSHLSKTLDNRDFNEIEQNDLIPFLYLINKKIPALMTAHIIFPKIDNNPVSFSPVWLKHILRKKLGFDGTLFSDDLNMEGANISDSFTDRILAAKEAGCDFTLVCNNRKSVIQALDHLPHNKLYVEKNKWLPLKANCIDKLDNRSVVRLAKAESLIKNFL